MIVSMDNIEQIAPQVFYNHLLQIAYLSMSSKGRSRTYGGYLTGIYTIGSKYTVSTNLTVFQITKYEMQIFDIDYLDAKHLANFDLQKDPDYFTNKPLLDFWKSKIRKLPNAYTTPPKPISSQELQPGYIVQRPNCDALYQVLNTQMLGEELCVKVICTYHPEFKELEGNTFFFKELIIVQRSESK